MITLHRSTTAALVATIVTASLALAPAASATSAPTRTGSTTSGTTAATGATTSPVRLGPFSCTSASIPTTPQSYATAGLAVTDIITINKIVYGGCTGPGGNVSVDSVGTSVWHITGGGATSGSNDVVRGSLDAFSVRVTSPICDVTLASSAPASFDEATQHLTVNESRTDIYTSFKATSVVKGCGGAISTGDHVKAFVDLQMSFTAGALRIG